MNEKLRRLIEKVRQGLAWCFFPFLRDSFRIVEFAAIILAVYAFYHEFEARQEERQARQEERQAQQEERQARREERLAQAAQLLPQVNFGKRWALELLNKEGIPLAELEIVPPALAQHTVWKDLSRSERENSTLTRRIGCREMTHLPRVKLNNAKLYQAILPCADMEYAELAGAYLLRADLRGGFLRCTVFTGAYLREAKLQGAQLHLAYLRGADMKRVRLRDAELYSADLQKADLQGAVLNGAMLDGADLRGAKGIDCRSLRMANGWEYAYRDESLACGEKIPQETPKSNAADHLPCGGHGADTVRGLTAKGVDQQ